MKNVKTVFGYVYLEDILKLGYQYILFDGKDYRLYIDKDKDFDILEDIEDELCLHNENLSKDLELNKNTYYDIEVMLENKDLSLFDKYYIYNHLGDEPQREELLFITNTLEEAIVNILNFDFESTLCENICIMHKDSIDTIYFYDFDKMKRVYFPDIQYMFDFLTKQIKRHLFSKSFEHILNNEIVVEEENGNNIREIIKKYFLNECDREEKNCFDKFIENLIQTLMAERLEDKRLIPYKYSFIFQYNMEEGYDLIKEQLIDFLNVMYN